eukprot:TRINITY_DN24064_c0_g1_i1.p2 TRINITY_DN24064_c0_g1~~TRINITY_DN24064_c0_g1_i1.p2  ORF type:complete len:117 (-),score=5.11 TRINITY_DN24064_c0_g1_i1:136-486(-)
MLLERRRYSVVDTNKTTGVVEAEAAQSRRWWLLPLLSRSVVEGVSCFEVASMAPSPEFLPCGVLPSLTLALLHVHSGTPRTDCLLGVAGAEVGAAGTPVAAAAAVVVFVVGGSTCC